VVVVRMAAHDLGVAQGVPELCIPGRLRPLQVDERARSEDDESEQRDDAPQDDESFSTTPATNASRSAREPSFTYAKSARASFCSAGMSRTSRGAKGPRRRS